MPMGLLTYEMINVFFFLLHVVCMFAYVWVHMCVPWSIWRPEIDVGSTCRSITPVPDLLSFRGLFCFQVHPCMHT